MFDWGSSTSGMRHADTYRLRFLGGQFLSLLFSIYFFFPFNTLYSGLAFSERKKKTVGKRTRGGYVGASGKHEKWETWGQGILQCAFCLSKSQHLGFGLGVIGLLWGCWS